MVQEKIKGNSIIAPPEEPRPKGTNIVDLITALPKSIGTAGDRLILGRHRDRCRKCNRGLSMHAG